MDINSQIFAAALQRELFALTVWSIVWTVIALLITWWILATAIRWGVRHALNDVTIRTSSTADRKMAPMGYRWVMVREETARKLDHARGADLRAD